MIFSQQNNYIKDNDETSNSGKSFSFNFETGDFEIINGKLKKTDGISALKIWIEKVIKTTKYKFNIYNNSDYGITDLKELITSELSLEFIQAEIERELKEVLTKNSNIKTVENFKFKRNKKNLTVSFECFTVFGEIESEVVF